MSRIDEIFAQAQAEDRAALGIFITGGDPDPKTSSEILLNLPQQGVDFIELGMPFSDPMADGPAIQAASLRALKNGTTLKDVLAMAKAFRAQHKNTPLILMGYYNPIYIYGVDQFLNDAQDAGVDGMIIVDLPPEEDLELCVPARAKGFDFIRLITPTTNEERLPKTLNNASGFIYYVAITGITGTRAASGQSVAEAMMKIRQKTSLPCVVGFGIRTPQQVTETAQNADGVVVGSAVVDTLAQSLDNEDRATDKTVPEVLALVKALSAGRHKRK